MTDRLRISSQISPAFLAACLIIPGVSGADIYKWKDNEGNIHYSEQPPAGIEAEVIKESVKADPGKALHDLREQTIKLKKIEQQRARQKFENTKESELMAVKKENCKVSRERLEKLENARMIRAVDEEGNVTRITEEAHQARIETARGSVEKWCD